MRVPLILLLLPACRPSSDTSPPPPDDTALTRSEATIGQGCDRLERVGWIDLRHDDGGLTMSGQIKNAPEPYTGVPVETHGHCTLHRYSASSCGDCQAPLVCAGDGDCVPPPAPFTDLHVTARSGDTWSFADADNKVGYLYKELQGEDLDWSLQLSFGQDRVTVPTMTVADGAIEARVVAEGDYDLPGALTVSWTPVDDGTVVRTEIPINHHAGVGTFTLCEAGAEVGGFTAPAELVDPLAVSTGLEFSYVQHLRLAAAETSVGCVELRFGSWLRVDPEWGR